MITPPPNQAPVQDKQGKIDAAWQAFFSDAFKYLVAIILSGNTASRPVKGLYVGRPYFDTTVGRPIWFDGTIWVYADGTPA